MTSLKANEILKNKFWIIEDADSKTKVGTLSKDNDNRYMYSCDTGSYFYDNKNAVEKTLGEILHYTVIILPSHRYRRKQTRKIKELTELVEAIEQLGHVP